MTLPNVWNQRTQSGFTLVELMIAMLLGLLIIGGVISVFLANKESYKTNETLSQAQDSARTAFELISRDIRQAGSTPCGNAAVGNTLTSLNGAGTDTYIWNSANPIQGFDDATAVQPALNNALVQSALVTQGVGRVSAAMIQPGSACGAAGVAMQGAPNGIANGDLVLACDTDQAVVFQAGGYNAGTSTLPLAAAGSPGNAAASLNCAGSFGQSAYVAPYHADYWYVAPAGAGAPAGVNSLWMSRFAGGGFVASEVVRGVQSMLITYHQIGGAGFVNAATIGAGGWSTVDAVHITLVFRILTHASNPNSEPVVRSFSTTIGIKKAT